MTLKAIWSELRDYPRGVYEEMRKVSWPDAQRTRRQTMVVLVIVAIATLIIGAMDFVYSRVFGLLFGL